MVVATEERQLNRLENQVDNGGGGAWDYLCLVRKLKVRRSDKVLKFGLSILKDPKIRSRLGNEEWTLYEQVAIAALDCQCLGEAKCNTTVTYTISLSGNFQVLWNANDKEDCIKTLSKKFPGSMRVGRLEAMLLEAKGSWADAETAYSRLLEDSPLDQVIHKRKVATAKAQGNLLGAIESLNKYLEIFMADHDAWRELAEIYVSLQMYKQAAFCYEELLLCQPTVPLYHLAYAEVLYTLGGLENLLAARKYYASTIDLSGGKNTKALFGICLCGFAINQLTRGRNKEEKDGLEMQSLAASALLKEYEQGGSSKLSLVASALNNMKLS